MQLRVCMGRVGNADFPMLVLKKIRNAHLLPFGCAEFLAWNSLVIAMQFEVIWSTFAYWQHGGPLVVFNEHVFFNIILILKCLFLWCFVTKPGFSYGNGLRLEPNSNNLVHSSTLRG